MTTKSGEWLEKLKLALIWNFLDHGKYLGSFQYAQDKLLSMENKFHVRKIIEILDFNITLSKQ